MSATIFSLDIGTRSVIGLLITKEDQHYRVIDYYMLEHNERSMLDGQIHDIVSVAHIIQKVKSHLENKHDITLDKVCVAAAGRALKTKRVTTTKEIINQPLLNQEDVQFFELEAVQKAQYQLATGDEDAHQYYYCVGYSVLRYSLDSEIIGSLIDQQGNQAEVEIIATFLPKVVVESLLSALTRADLQLEALTLEPIAAIHVLIPPSMRRLNVALVDVGAGTSDIAITSEGTVTAYGMVSKAGDEITEAISDHYLLDFNQAEDFKKEITLHHKATTIDILGFEQEVTYDELIEHILPAVDQLALSITEEMITLNGTPPKAVMLVGGGSQTPELASRLASRLNLPTNRVAIRDVDAIQLLSKEEGLPIGPEFITPIGIAIAAKQNPVQYVSVTVNNRVIRMFEMKRLTIADCLLAAGININKLFGRPGMAAIIDYNGKSVTLPGSFGEAPIILLNGEKKTIEDGIQNGDILEITRGTDGQPAQMMIEEFIGETPHYTIFLDEEPYSIKPNILVNNKPVNLEYQLKDSDRIIYNHQLTVNDFLNEQKLSEQLSESFVIWIDDQQINMEEFSKTIFHNGRPAKLDTWLKSGDQLKTNVTESPLLKDILKKLEVVYEKQLTVIYNQRPLRLSKELLHVYRNGEELTLNDEINHQDNLQLVKRKETPFIFQDIFRFISLDLTKATGKVEMKKNKQPVSFFDELQANDNIEIQIDN